VELCIRATQPLLVALRIADGDETPAAPEIMAAMDHAKAAIKDSLKDKPNLLKEVLEYFDKRWENQMEQQLYGAALYLNPSKYFAIREKDRRQATKLRIMFNQVMWKMVSDDEDQNKISKQADDYERSEGQSFSKPGAIRDRDRKNPSKFSNLKFCIIISLPFLKDISNELIMDFYTLEWNLQFFGGVHMVA